MFSQLAESDFASTFRLLTVFAYGTYADYLGNRRGWRLEVGEGQFTEGLRRNSWDTRLRSLKYTGSGSRPELAWKTQKKKRHGKEPRAFHKCEIRISLSFFS